jgi:nucleotide-binding universal stress UspA family protein
MEGAFLSRTGDAPASKQQSEGFGQGAAACANARSVAPFSRKGREMRTYLVVMDETEEAICALRFAARRAARTGGTVEILALIPKQEFVEWGGVQAAMEEEARLRAEAMVLQAAGEISEEAGIKPSVTVRLGDPVKAVSELLKEREDISALILAAAREGGPGPLVSHFAGSIAGSLPCPLIIVPGSLDDEALARLA